MESKNYSDETVHYVFDDLNEEEKALFEEKLKSDPDLVKNVDLLRKIIHEVKAGIQLERILNDPGYEEAKKLAEKAVRDYNRHKRREYLMSKSFFRNYIIPIAASILVLMYVGNYIYFVQNPDLAFEKYYKDFSTEYYAKATINEAQVIFAHSLEEYKKGNFEAIADDMRALMEKGELNIRGQVMLALHDAWNDPPLHRFKKQKHETKHENATLLLAVASMKLNEFETALNLLSDISKQSGKIGKKAARLERKIGRVSP